MGGATIDRNSRAKRYNPYKPNDIIHAGMFVGRLDEIDAIERCLFQTKNGNPQHFLVQGERGIGKSSLLFIVNMIACGNITTQNGEYFRFLSVPLDLGGCNTQAEVVRKIGRGLRKEIGARQALRERAKVVWEWLTNWEILGVSYNKASESFDAEEVAEQFVENLSAFCNVTSDEVDGILFLIDEADRPSVEVGLGSYLKLVSERLRWQNCQRVVFGLAGLPVLLSKLRESHESSPRLFQTFSLEQLSTDERTRVVERGLEEAEERNGYKTHISPEALKFLAELSEGYPHFVQQFAYSAFEQDRDNNITIDDVGEAAYKDGGALSQLGDKYFSTMYHSRIASDDYRAVLHEMANFGDQWVSRKQILAGSGLAGTTVTNALNALKAREIILADESRKNRGFYRLPTKSFAAWIKAFRSIQESGISTEEGVNF